MAYKYSEFSVIDLSIVIPLNNEVDNIKPLYRMLKSVLDKQCLMYEIVFVDDGSTDGTSESISSICENDENCKLIMLTKNFGQSAALSAGFDNSKGRILVSLDGDLQHNPEDIPSLIKKINEGYDIVSGWRKHRIDNMISRRLPSFIANKIMSLVFGVKLQDFGTTLKAYRREVLEDIELFGELHRFIPVLAGWKGARIAEVPITNVLRKSGKSHYGIMRTWRVILDLFTVKFLTSFINRPFHFFGAIGVICFNIGLLAAIMLTIGYYFFNLKIQENLGNLIFAVSMIIFGFQLIAMGISLELSARIYYSTNKKKPYCIKNIFTKSNI